MTDPEHPLAKADTGSRRDQGQEIRDRREVVAEILRRIPLALHSGKAEIVPGSGETWTVRGNAGSNLGQFFHRNLAQFMCDAVGHLVAFSAYIEQLEREAYDNRNRFRRQDQLLKDISDELLGADSLGLGSKEGQRRIRQAVHEERRGRRFDDWDDFPATRRPPR